MNAREANRLLYLLSAHDRREVNADVAEAWALALREVPFDLAVRAADRAIRLEHDRYITVGVVREHLTYLKRAVERDVRVAKQLRIIDAAWPADRPLPADADARLQAWRQREWAANNDRPEDIAPLTGRPVDLGLELKRPPAEDGAA